MHWDQWCTAMHREPQNRTKTIQKICSLSTQHNCWPYKSNLDALYLVRLVKQYHGQWWSIFNTHLKGYSYATIITNTHTHDTYCTLNNGGTCPALLGCKLHKTLHHLHGTIGTQVNWTPIHAIWLAHQSTVESGETAQNYAYTSYCLIQLFKLVFR